jgi:hypothetical protein
MRRFFVRSKPSPVPAPEPVTAPSPLAELKKRLEEMLTEGVKRADRLIAQHAAKS